MLGLRLDSLRKLERLDGKISEMHVMDRKFLEKDQSNQTETFFWEKIFGLFSFVGIAFVGTFYIVKSRRNFRKDKLKMESEIELMKSDVSSYSQENHSNERFVNPQSISENFEKLTDRQKELLQLIADGFSNKEIADKLFISESTVKYHIKNIYSILGLKDRKDFFRKLSQN
ncbi:Transcriptional regulatory protein DegU [compost metagenome]